MSQRLSSGEKPEALAASNLARDNRTFGLFTERRRHAVLHHATGMAPGAVEGQDFDASFLWPGRQNLPPSPIRPVSATRRAGRTCACGTTSCATPAPCSGRRTPSAEMLRSTTARSSTAIACSATGCVKSGCAPGSFVTSATASPGRSAATMLPNWLSSISGTSMSRRRCRTWNWRVSTSPPCGRAGTRTRAAQRHSTSWRATRVPRKTSSASRTKPAEARSGT